MGVVDLKKCLFRKGGASCQCGTPCTLDLLQSVFLGLVQGLTEFLPVSSSGHLALLEALFGIGDAPLFYDVMLHVGTLAAVLIVLWPEIVGLVCHPVRNKFLMLVIATIPAVVVTLVCNNVVPDAFENVLNGKYLAFGFYGTSVVLVVSELVSRNMKGGKKVMLPQASVMGLMQAAAILPGLSRSGSTIAGGLFCGVQRERAANYAFLMSVPTILGGLVFSVKDVAENGLGPIDVPGVVLGTVVAGVAGYFAVRFMLRLITNHRLYGFAVYTAALGTLVLLESTVLDNPMFASLNPFA